MRNKLVEAVKEGLKFLRQKKKLKKRTVELNDSKTIKRNIRDNSR